MTQMNRRNFLLATGAAVGTGVGMFFRPRGVQADGLPTQFSRKLLNLTLPGGPDLRHLIVPPPSAGGGMYGGNYWKYRASSHNIGENDGASRYANDYLPVTQIAGRPVTEFGVLKKAAWLHAEIVAGRVAIVCNVQHSNDRDHAHSLLVLQSGDTATSAYSTDRDGWGGRLAASVTGNVFSMTRQRLLFCNLPSPAGTSQVISARNTRSFGLSVSTAMDSARGGKAVSDRALSSYYAALRQGASVPAGSPYKRFVESEQVLRGFTQSVRDRLASNPVPMAISGLYGNGGMLKRNPFFGEQMRNVYDCLACEDLIDTTGRPFNFRVGSLEYGGWDSHKNQRDAIEPQFEEIFGDGKGLSSLRAAVMASMPAALPNLVTVVAGEFGRQLRSNGDRGTDHGRGNFVFLLGDGVRGGVYGEMFPMDEITTLVDGKNKYERFNEDIKGKTALSQLFGSIADWVANNDTAGNMIFPNRAMGIVEQGVTMNRMSLFQT